MLLCIKKAEIRLKQINHDSSQPMWLRLQVSAYKKLSVLCTIDHPQELGLFHSKMLVQHATCPSATLLISRSSDWCWKAPLHMNRADHRAYENILGESSSHTSHLWMCWNSRRIDCIWLRDSGSNEGQNWLWLLGGEDIDDIWEPLVWNMIHSIFQNGSSYLVAHDFTPRNMYSFSSPSPLYFRLSMSHSWHMLYCSGHQLFWETVQNKMLSRYFISLGAIGL